MTVTVLAIVALLVPAVITLIISFVFIPGPTASSTTPKSLVWRRKIWEWNTAWMGLALSCASTFAITEGLKDLAGKPRPYAINKCNPDLSAIDLYRVGGLGTSFDRTGATPILVSSGICQVNDPSVLREIFASWPSGHSSFSWAGLLYLSLYLCSKFAVGIPYLKPTSYKHSDENTYDYDTYIRSPHDDHTSSHPQSASSSSTTHENAAQPQFTSPPPRNSSAAPPIYLLLLSVYLPIGTAIFVCVSRWFDFHHHGIDILSGAFIGAFTAYFSFRYYHMPIRRGSGWSWGARSRGRAFWVGVGRDGYVGTEGWMTGKIARDVELGKASREAVGKDTVLGSGRTDPGDVPSQTGSQVPLQGQQHMGSASTRTSN